MVQTNYIEDDDPYENPNGTEKAETGCGECKLARAGQKGHT
jgi:hypothetical protein